MKTCYVCGIPKNTTEFYSDRSRRDGFENKCKKCSNRLRMNRQERADTIF